MKILSVEISKSSRLELAGIKNIKIIPKSGIMVILGPNSSGKSSLLQMLSPLPEDKNDFEKEGYKIIRVEHNGIIYKLSSEFNKETKYSFIIESTGEELNIGGTITYQKQLVKDYFNYTDKIHALLLGKERFTSMSPNRRKEWFSLLCDTDYTYIINVFNKCKEKLRDSQGALKKNKSLLLQINNTDDTEDINNIVNTIKEKEEKISNLQKIINYDENFNRVDYLDKLNTVIDKLDNTIKDNSKDTLSLIKSINSLGIDSNTIEQIEVKSNTLEIEINKLKHENSILIENFTELEKKIKQYAVIDDSELIELNKQISSLMARRSSQIDLIRLGDTYPYLKEESQYKLNLWRNNEGEILEVIRSLINVNGKYKNKDLEVLVEEKNKLREQYNKENNILLKLQERYSIMEEKRKQDKIKCPNCSHEFHDGFNITNYNKLQEIIPIKTKLVNELNTKIEEIEKEIEVVNNNNLIVKRFNNICVNLKDLLKDYYITVMKNEMFINEPMNVETLLFNIVNDITIYSNVDNINTEIKAIEEKISLSKSTNVKYYNSLKEEMEKLSNRIHLVNDNINTLVKTKEENDKILNLYKDLDNKIKQLEEQSNKRIELESKYIDKTIFDKVNEIILEERNQIASLSKKQIEILTKSKNIELIENTIKELEVEVVTWSNIIDIINPQDGLIAEGLLRYIKVFISRMNGFIKSIWTYPLVIHPTKESEENNGELSYRFPLTVGLSKKDRKDIQDGSDGVKEVIDLAFKMIAMKSLGLSHYPIFLDEFGRTFDETHRDNALKLIDKFSEEFIDDQIFMVSHFYQQYSSIEESITYCVLSEDNIVLPSKNVNTLVEITK